MPDRFKPGETTGLYLLMFGFCLFFFAFGVLVGRWLPREETLPEPLTVAIPEEDSDPDLGIYRELAGSDPGPPGGDPVRQDAPAEAVRANENKPQESPETSDPPPVKPGPISFTVQVGALEDIRLVNQLVLRLGAKGYPARVIEPGERENTAYWIWVDLLETRAEAKALETRLKEDGFATYLKQVQGAVRQ